MGIADDLQSLHCLEEMCEYIKKKKIDGQWYFYIDFTREND